MGSRENFARRPDQVVDGCLAASFCWCCGALQSRLDGQAPKSRLDGQAPTGQVWAETPLWQRIEGAVDGGLGDVGEAEVVVAGIGPQPGEGLVQMDAGAFGDHALGLLDHHAAGQGARELLVQALGLGGGTTDRVARSAKARATMTSASPIGVCVALSRFRAPRVSSRSRSGRASADR